MSVIAKIQVRGVDSHHYGHTIDAACVCENDLMASNSKANEDILFTQASPWGEARITLKENPNLVQGDNLYVIFTKRPQTEAMASGKVMVPSITDFGGTSKRVSITAAYRSGPATPGDFQTFRFEITIDNPKASEQFKAGDEDWHAGIYRASLVSQSQAIELAHSFKDLPAT